MFTYGQLVGDRKLSLAVVQAPKQVHPYSSIPANLRYRSEIFILGVLGFLKTTESFPKIPEEVCSLPKKSEVF